jgi:dipeptidyl aminopeptidase/acylaminoacyl peptidase
MRTAVTLPVALLAALPLRAQQAVPTYTIEQFMATTAIFGASFSPDERSILVNTDQTGVFNLYEVPVAGGPMQQVTNSTDDAIFTVGFFPQDRRLLYLQDRGGDENDHLYVRLTDGSVRDLTPGDSLKAVFFDWAHDRGSFFYGTNERDRRFFDVFEAPTATLEPQLVFQDTVGLLLGSVSTDGQWIAFVKTITTNNSDIYLRDNRTGEITHITPHTGNVNFQPATFSRDSRHLYYVTDEGGEFAYLVRRDLASGEITEVERADWDVMFAAFSRQGTYLVVGINNDARTEIRIYEAATNRPVELPAIPDGDVTGVVFSPSERYMAFYVNGDRSPSNLYVLDMETREVRRLTDSMNPAIDPDHLVDGTVVRYASYDGVEIPSLQYVPPGAGSGQSVPAILWIHGGPGGQTRLGYAASRQFLVNHGYAVLAVNNRGSSGYGKTFFAMDDRKHGEADLDDIVWAKRYLATQPWADTGKVVILGGSYGGYLTLAGVTFRPDAFAAGVDLFGISNWVRTLESIPPWWEAFREALYAEMGDPATDHERLHRISPLFHADRIASPLMVLQGANDPRVLQVESDEIVQAIRDRGGVVEYVVFPDEGHGFVKKENQITAWRAVLAFLNRHVRGIGTEAG